MSNNINNQKRASEINGSVAEILSLLYLHFISGMLRISNCAFITGLFQLRPGTISFLLGRAVGNCSACHRFPYSELPHIVMLQQHCPLGFYAVDQHKLVHYVEVDGM